MKSLEAFGERLRQARVIKGLTQDDLAGRLGINRVSVSHWERGISLPDTIRMVDLARIFGDEVFDWAEAARSQETSSRVRARPGRLREDFSNHAAALRMPQSAYDLVLRRLNEMRSAGLSESVLGSAELVLCGSYLGKSPRELSALGEREWIALIDGGWQMLKAVYQVETPEQAGSDSLEPPTPSIERAAVEAEVLRQLPALPPLAKKKGKRRA